MQSPFIASARYSDRQWDLYRTDILPQTEYVARKWKIPVAQLRKSGLLAFSFLIPRFRRKKILLKLQHSSTEEGAFLTVIDVHINTLLFLKEFEPIPHEWEGPELLNWERFDITKCIRGGEKNVIEISLNQKSGTVYFLKHLVICDSPIP